MKRFAKIAHSPAYCDTPFIAHARIHDNNLTTTAGQLDNNGRTTTYNFIKPLELVGINPI